MREAYRKKGWSFAVRHNIKQCSQEGFNDWVESQRGEGCGVYGYGDKKWQNFHFAPAKASATRMTVADLFGFTLKSGTCLRVIDSLSATRAGP